MIAASTQHRVCRNIMILDDKVFENDETFHIILCLPPGPVDSRLRFTITRLYITIIDTTVFEEGESIEFCDGRNYNTFCRHILQLVNEVLFFHSNSETLLNMYTYTQ